MCFAKLITTTPMKRESVKIRYLCEFFHGEHLKTGATNWERDRRPCSIGVHYRSTVHYTWLIRMVCFDNQWLNAGSTGSLRPIGWWMILRSSTKAGTESQLGSTRVRCPTVGCLNCSFEIPIQLLSLNFASGFANHWWITWTKPVPRLPLRHLSLKLPRNPRPPCTIYSPNIYTTIIAKENVFSSKYIYIV